MVVVKRALIAAAFAVLAFATPAFAQNGTVSSMTGASALTGSELLYCVQGGVDRKCTPSQIATLVGNGALVFTPDIVMTGPYGQNDTLIYSNNNISGTCSNSGNPCPVWRFIANTFAVNGSSGQAELARVYANFGGAGQIGGVNLFDVSLNVNAATGNLSNAFYTAGFFSANSSVNDGGSVGTALGSLFAFNPQSVLTTGATFWIENSVEELDLTNQTGTSVKYSYLSKALLKASNAVVPSVEAGGYIVGMQTGGTASLNCAYCLAAGSGVAGRNAVASTGSLIGTQGATTAIAVASGIDFTAYAFSNAPIVAPLATPASSSAACKQGSIEWDAGFIYICTATNTWKRAALTTF